MLVTRLVCVKFQVMQYTFNSVAKVALVTYCTPYTEIGYFSTIIKAKHLFYMRKMSVYDQTKMSQ